MVKQAKVAATKIVKESVKKNGSHAIHKLNYKTKINTLAPGF